MKTSLERFVLGEDGFSDDTFVISVYEEYITIVSNLSLENSAKAMSIGGVDNEQKWLNLLLRAMLKKPFDNLKIFNSEIEAGKWQNSVNFDTPNLSNGGWSKTAFILLSEENFESDLDAALKYLKSCYLLFKNPRGQYEDKAKRIVSKYFSD